MESFPIRIRRYGSLFLQQVFQTVRVSRQLVGDSFGEGDQQHNTQTFLLRYRAGEFCEGEASETVVLEVFAASGAPRVISGHGIWQSI